MTYNSYAAFGRIVSVTPGTTGEDSNESYYLRVVVSVYTGERKKEEDEYAPSILVQFTLWNNRAHGLEPYLEPGRNIIFSGKLGTPNTYLTSDGEPRATLRLHVVDEITITDRKEDTVKSKRAEVKPAAKSTKNSTKPSARPSKLVERLDEDGDLSFDLDF